MSLIAQNLKTMFHNKDRGALQSKRKAISALLPFAVLQERDGKPEMLKTFLRATKTSNQWEFAWYRVGKYARGLLHEGTPRAIVLVSPYIRCGWSTDKEDFIRRWAVAASAVPYTEKAAQSVVDTLLQIASKEELLPYIPIRVWSWLARSPSLPPICLGRNVGTCAHVVKAVRALKDIEVLKSYFLLVWSEWNHFSPTGSSVTVPYHYNASCISSSAAHRTSTSSVCIPILLCRSFSR